MIAETVTTEEGETAEIDAETTMTATEVTETALTEAEETVTTEEITAATATTGETGTAAPAITVLATMTAAAANMTAVTAATADTTAEIDGTITAAIGEAKIAGIEETTKITAIIAPRAVKTTEMANISRITEMANIKTEMANISRTMEMANTKIMASTKITANTKITEMVHNKTTETANTALPSLKMSSGLMRPSRKSGNATLRETSHRRRCRASRCRKFLKRPECK